MSRSKHLPFGFFRHLMPASDLIMLRRRIKRKFEMFFESQISDVCNSNSKLNLSLTDVEPEYPVQCWEEGNWRIPTENDDRTNVEGTSVHIFT